MKISPFIQKRNIALLSGFAIFFMACDENTLDNTKEIERKDIPSQVVRNAYIVQRDSGMVKLRAKAPLIEKYELIDTPFVEAKKGINIDYFDRKNPDKPGKISANYAKMIELKKFIFAKGNVRILTQEGQLFTMNTIYWNQDKKIIYTHDTVHITDKDGSKLVASKGMTAKDDFSEYTFNDAKGDISTQKIPEKEK